MTWFSGSTLVVRSDDNATGVTVDQLGSTIRISDVWTSRQWNYASSSLSRVEFQGGRGNDRFVNNVSNLPVTAFGGDGDDYLEGYDAIDQLIGGNGNDTLIGFGGDDSIWAGNGNDSVNAGSGNDVVYGGSGNDLIIGAAGNDSLFGEHGNDSLFGELGNDSLYGGQGTDSLYGGDGNDGLFGGVGARDYLNGGAGADRFLTTSHVRRESYYRNDWDRLRGHRSYRDVTVVEDAIGDRASADSVTHFRNLAGTSVNLNGFGTVQFGAGQWNDSDIQTIDGALRNLHSRVGNTRLLKTAPGGDLVFDRAGSQLNGTHRGRFGGWNSGGGRIAFTSLGLRDAASARLTTYHEIAHNWDEANENRFINQFSALSGWRNGPATGFSPATDGSQWHFWSQAAFTTFARNYGRHNPHEDFATTWESYFDRRYHGGQSTGLRYVASKHAALDTFFASLA